MFVNLINIEHKKYQNDILIPDENYHDTQHFNRVFWNLHMLISNFQK